LSIETLDRPEWNRLLPLESAFNLRDFGGYASSGGGHVRRGMLYRSGTMHHLTEEDERRLVALGIATVFDLRRRKEREAEPTRWCEAAGLDLLSRDHDQSAGVLEELLKGSESTASMMRDAILDLYRALPREHALSYRIIFERLLAGKAPLLLHCAAGKDRTGVGAALILSALDVPRELILADYVMTAEVADFDRILSRHAARFPRELLAPLLASEPEYLLTAFAEIEREHGSVDAFLEDQLGIGSPERRRLRELLVD
jgi:protein-tyrosine phosphatase